MTLRIHFSRKFACAQLSALFLIACSSFVDAAGDGPRIEIGGGGAYVDLPSIEGIAATVTETTNLGFLASPTVVRQSGSRAFDVEGFGPAGTISGDFPFRRHGGDFSRVSLYVQGSYGDWDEGTTQVEQLGATEQFQLIGINTSVTAPASFAPAVTTNVEREAQMLDWRGMFAFENDRGTRMSRWTLGVVGTNLDQEYMIRSAISALPAVNQTITGDLETTYIGLGIGVDQKFRASDAAALSWIIGGEIAAMHADAELDARQSFNLAAGGGMDSAVTHSDEASGFAARARIKLGFEHALSKSWTWGVEGGFSYLSWVGTAVHPSATVGSERAALATNPRSLNIDDEDALSADVMLKTRMTF